MDDFAYNKETGLVDFCPAGHAPETCQRDEESKTTRIEKLAEVCKGCPLFEMCPISKRRGKHFVLEFTDRQQRLAARRVEEQTAVFQERYRKAHAGFRGDGIEGARIYMTGLMGSDSGFTT